MLNPSEVEKSRQIYGVNELKGKKRKSFIRSYLSSLNDPIIKVLIVAFVINVVVMLPHVNYLECAGILLSVLISTLVSTICEYSSENAFEKLKNSGQEKTSIVKRVGDVCEIPSKEIVVGDTVVLEAGCKVPADLILLSGKIKVDESSLTGESGEVEKQPYDKIGISSAISKIKESLSSGSCVEIRLNEGKIVYSGSTVTEGYAEALVISVGEKTYLGKEADTLSEVTRPSPLKLRLLQLAKLISKIGYVAAGLIAFAFLFNSFVIDSGFIWDEIIKKITDVRFLVSHLISALTLAVSITVVAVPEGLPMMITVVLSSNMKKMARDNVLIKKMVGIETAGNVNLLFTDKTGTITEGKLRATEIVDSSGNSFFQFSLKSKEKLSKYLNLCAYFCTNSTKQGTKIVGSDSVERALLDFTPFPKPSATVLEKIPFDSDKKYSAVKLKSSSNISIFKGAPEIILEGCTSYLDENENIRELTKEKEREIVILLSELSKKGKRVIAVSIKEDDGALIPKNMTFAFFVSLKDKIRKRVNEAIKEVTLAGVGVVMITGDSRDTAESIARESGIISFESKRHLVLDASSLHQMDDSEVKKILPTLAVLSRALPSDKSRLVRLAQESGYVVGMTGDGVNDASSLKSADVGFAMGTGTEIAKEASDVVIKDNNFASIVKAILYGRTIFSSIRKFVTFQLIMNLSAVGISLIGPFIGVDSPVTITQMLWVNIIMDTLGALAFASEPPLKEYMNHPPIKREEKILTRRMIFEIVSVASYVLSMCVWFLKSDTGAMILSNGSEKYMLSAFFALFVFTGVFVCFTARARGLNILRGLYKNKAFLPIMIGVMLVQIFFIYFGMDALRTVPLRFVDLLSVILLAFSVIIFDTIRKILIRLLKLSRKNSNRKLIFERKKTNVK